MWCLPLGVTVEGLTPSHAAGARTLAITVNRGADRATRPKSVALQLQLVPAQQAQ